MTDSKEPYAAATAEPEGTIVEATETQHPIEADYEVDDEGYAETTASSYVSSIASSIRRGVEENGRLYPSMQTRHLAATPIDETEMDRNDLQHCKFSLLLDGRLHLSPIGENPTAVLDLGTGTGIWCIDMADKYPSAEVIGVDLAPVQPTWVPPNCHFEIEDIENEWLFKKNHFNLIQGRELMLAVRDWPHLLSQCMDHLKPGGWVEFQGSYPLIASDDGTLPEGTAYEETGFLWFDIGDALGASSRAPAQWKEYLEQAGFEDIQEYIFKIPTNPWPKDKRLKQVGALELAHYRESITGIFLRGFVTGLDRSQAEMELIFAQAKDEVMNRKMHTYLRYYVVFGRRPDHRQE